MLLHATVCCHHGSTLTKICDAGRPATFYCDLHSERNNVIDHSCTPTNRRKGAQAFDKLNCSEIPIGFDRNCPSCLQDIDLSGAGFPVTTLNRSIVFVLGGPGSGKGTQVSPLTSTRCQHASLTNHSWPMTVFITTRSQMPTMMILAICPEIR